MSRVYVSCDHTGQNHSQKQTLTQNSAACNPQTSKPINVIPSPKATFMSNREKRSSAIFSAVFMASFPKDVADTSSGCVNLASLPSFPSLPPAPFRGADAFSAIAECSICVIECTKVAGSFIDESWKKNGKKTFKKKTSRALKKHKKSKKNYCNIVFLLQLGSGRMH